MPPEPLGERFAATRLPAYMLELPPRTPLPSAKTLTRTVDVLHAEWLVRTIPGRGIYVVPPSER